MKSSRGYRCACLVGAIGAVIGLAGAITAIAFGEIHDDIGSSMISLGIIVSCIGMAGAAWQL
jgi:hypothetical protein